MKLKNGIYIKGFIVGCFLWFFVFCIQLNAEGNHRRDYIQSKGKIQFETGEVMITADDFIYLADKIDDLEGTYKISLVNSLNAINTYFRSDGSLVYDGNLNEIQTDEQKIKLSFDRIKQGILNSHSIEILKNTQATDVTGAPLYVNDTANNLQEHLNTTVTDTGFPLYYKEAYADNLSAGTAAWVNGVMIKGNGEDNRISWQNGYNEGYSKGVAEALGNLDVIYSYHTHEGNTSQVGGCYGNLTGIKPVLCGCTSYVYANDNGHPYCANCYHNHEGKCQGTVSYTQYTYIGLNCGKTEETIESVTIVY